MSGSWGRRLVGRPHLSFEGHNVPLHPCGNLDELLSVGAFKALAASLLVLHIHDGVGVPAKKDTDERTQDQAKVSFNGKMSANQWEGALVETGGEFQQALAWNCDKIVQRV